MSTSTPDRSSASPTGAPSSHRGARKAADGRGKHRRHWIEVAVVLVIVAVFAAGGLASRLRHHGEAPADRAAAPNLSPAASGQPALSDSPGRSTRPSADEAALAAIKMPVGNLPGWKQTFVDDFNGAKLSSKWNVYDGQPGGDPGGWWKSSHVSVANGMLQINGSKESTPHGPLYVTGGISNSPSFSQKYGRFEVRFRMDKGYGVAYALLLWPTSDIWPPEIDIVEDDGRLRQYTTSTMHYGKDDLKIHKKVDGDFTKWHTAAVDWTPGHIIYYLDGKVWATIDSRHVPSVPMHIALQTQAWYCTSNWAPCPNATTPKNVNLVIDWVVGYKWLGS